MKRIISLLTFVSLVVVMIACDKYDSKPYDGKWQLQTIEENNIIQEVDTIYYNFLTSVFSYQIYDAANHNFPQYYGYKTMIDDNTMLLEFEPRKVTEETILRRTDWTGMNREFKVEKISKSKMILYSEGKRYTFRNF